VDTQRNTEDATESDGYSRRELLRNGLLAGGGAAAFVVTLSSVAAGTAAAAGSSLPTVSLGLAPQWPWGDTVNNAAPFYLSPDGGIPSSGPASSTPVTSALPVSGAGQRTGLSAPLLVIPLLVHVKPGNPAAVALPFGVSVEALGDGLAAETEAVILFQTSWTMHWLAVVPVILGSGSITLEALIQGLGATQQTGSNLTISGDFSQAPLASSLPIADQTSLVGHIASQSLSDFSVKSVFTAISNASLSAQAQLVANKSSAISIGDMFGLQMLANNINQLSESSLQVLSEVNTAITDQARNIKG
jgi:hypothetical protein